MQTNTNLYYNRVVNKFKENMNKLLLLKCNLQLLK